MKSNVRRAYMLKTQRSLVLSTLKADCLIVYRPQRFQYNRFFILLSFGNALLLFKKARKQFDGYSAVVNTSTSWRRKH